MTIAPLARSEHLNYAIPNDGKRATPRKWTGRTDSNISRTKRELEYFSSEGWSLIGPPISPGPTEARGGPRMGSEHPMESVAANRYPPTMNLLLIVVVLLLLFGGGGYYYGGPGYGGGGLGLVLVVCLIIYLMGGFRGKK